jgi:transposase
VIGLLTDPEGYPLAVEVFEGNTNDTKTVSSQIKKLAQRFGLKQATLVGDKGMIKTAQIEEITNTGFSYITSITKQQIETLIKKDVFQQSLFDNELMEVAHEGVRYVFRRNPMMADQIRLTREDKILGIQESISRANKYLTNHPKARIEKQTDRLEDKIKKYRVDDFCKIQLSDDANSPISLVIDNENKELSGRLDGCYVMKTNLSKNDATASEIHSRYKNLHIVEDAFKTIKTGYLELRPIYVRRESRVRGHVFVTMLSYLLIHEFWQMTKHLNKTREAMISTLENIHTTHLELGQEKVCQVPTISDEAKKILESINISIPEIL